MIDVKTLSIFGEALRDGIRMEQYQPIWEAWRQSLPAGFTLGGCAGFPNCTRHHAPIEPLVFVHDPNVPGLYRAKFKLV
jgi:hypothetical protein